MIEDVTQHDLFSLAELNHLRLEAMRLFEDCLTSGDDSKLVEFIGQQLLHEPPRLQLLSELADDLQQRLLSLREYHFDVRDRVVRTFGETYGVDITPLTPAHALEKYHGLTTEQVLNFAIKSGAVLENEDAALLEKMVEASVQMAEQLYNDIQLTTHLHHLVLDWLDGMKAITARKNWNNQPPPHTSIQH
jgi:hypothetical protein